MELRAIKIQRLDVLLHRGLPFALVIAFLVASIIIAFTNPTAGAAGLLATVAGVLTAYLTGRTSVSRDRRGTPPPGSQRADGSKRRAARSAALGRWKPRRRPSPAPPAQLRLHLVQELLPLRRHAARTP
jgi:hypothetical protein